MWTTDSAQVVTGSEDNTAKIWNAASGHCTATLKVSGRTATAYHSHYCISQSAPLWQACAAMSGPMAAGRRRAGEEEGRRRGRGRECLTVAHATGHCAQARFEVRPYTAHECFACRHNHSKPAHPFQSPFCCCLCPTLPQTFPPHPRAASTRSWHWRSAPTLQDCRLHLQTGITPARYGSAPAASPRPRCRCVHVPAQDHGLGWLGGVREEQRS